LRSARSISGDERRAAPRISAASVETGMTRHWREPRRRQPLRAPLAATAGGVDEFLVALLGRLTTCEKAPVAPTPSCGTLEHGCLRDPADWQRMRPLVRRIILGTVLALGIAGCGSQTPNVTVTGTTSTVSKPQHRNSAVRTATLKRRSLCPAGEFAPYGPKGGCWATAHPTQVDSPVSCPRGEASIDGGCAPACMATASCAGEKPMVPVSGRQRGGRAPRRAQHLLAESRRL